MLVIALAIGAFLFFSPGHGLYTVKSESMAPALNLGDVIVTGPPGKALGASVVPGSIITFQQGNELVTHRVVRQEGNSYITQGDALEEPDRTAVESSQVVGAYLFKIPKLGYLVNFMQTRLGWYLVVILPTLIVLALIFIEIGKEVVILRRNRA